MRGACDTEAAASEAEARSDGTRPLRARRAAAAQAAELIARVAQASGGDGEDAFSSRAPRSRRSALPPPPDPAFEPVPALYNAVAMGEFDLGDFLAMQLPPPEPAAVHALLPPAPATTGAALAGMQAATVHVKLPNLMSPAALPQGLNGAALAMFAAPPIAITALARPGCVLLTLDALLDGGGPLSARDAVAALKSGQAASFFRLQPFSVATAASFATSSEDGIVHADDVAAHAPPPRVRPMAALAWTDVALCFSSPVGAKGRACDAEASVSARLHGHALQLRPLRGGGATLASAAGAEGVALIEVLPSGMEPQHAPPPRPVLLCDDAAIVAEICAAADAADVSADAADALECAVHVLGTALRPGACIPVLAAACAAAAERGWAAALTRLLPALRAAVKALGHDSGSAAALLCTRGGASLLHRACAARSASAAAMLTTHDGLFGAIATCGPDGLTPAHHAAIAAAAADGAALMLALTATGDGLVAWFYARDRSGVPPAHYAPAALNAPLLQRLAAARARADAAVAAVLSRAFFRPELAAVEAMTHLAEAGDDDAAAILRWMQIVLMRAHGDDGQGGAPPKGIGAAVDDDEGFMRWQAAQNRPLWRVMSILLLLKALGNVVHCVRFLMYGPDSAGAAARAFVASTPLLNPSTGAMVLATDLPLDTLRRGARHMLLATALFRVPHGAAAVWLVYSRAGWALTLARHEAVMGAILLGEALFFVYTDALLRHITGGLEVEWPAKLMLLRALAVTFAMRTGPFRTAANRAGMLARSASTGVALALRPALRGRLWHNIGYRTSIILLLFEALAERPNQRRLRHAYSAYAAKLHAPTNRGEHKTDKSGKQE